jgi:hypothetical protein
LDENEQLQPKKPPAVAGCRTCGRPPKWESIVDYLGERWLGVCVCGRLDVFLPDYPHIDCDDPLQVYLAGPGRTILPATPPWLRLFMNSLEEPHNTSWKYLPGYCDRCGSSVSFGTQAWPRPGVNARYLLCLNCGEVAANQTQPWRNLSQTTIGSAWTPACPAVKSLRDHIYRTPQRPVSGNEHSTDSA